MKDLGLTPGTTSKAMRLTDEEPLVELSDAEIEALAGAKKLQGPLKRIRTTHHRIAQLMSAGLKDVEISKIMGFSQSRLSILKGDPAFRELLTYYMEAQHEHHLEVQDRFLSLGLEAMSELHERLLDNPEELSEKQLLDIATFGLDRAGFSPIQRSQSATLTGTLSPQQVEDIKRGVRERAQGNVTTKGNFRPAGSGVLSPASTHSQGEAEGQRGGGEDLREEGGEVPHSVEQTGGIGGKPFPRAVD